jgi:hypothetical protein
MRQRCDARPWTRVTTRTHIQRPPRPPTAHTRTALTRCPPTRLTATANEQRLRVAAAALPRVGVRKAVPAGALPESTRLESRRLRLRCATHTLLMSSCTLLLSAAVMRYRQTLPSLPAARGGGQGGGGGGGAVRGSARKCGSAGYKLLTCCCYALSARCDGGHCSALRCRNESWVAHKRSKGCTCHLCRRLQRQTAPATTPMECATSASRRRSQLQTRGATRVRAVGGGDRGESEGKEEKAAPAATWSSAIMQQESNGAAGDGSCCWSNRQRCTLPMRTSNTRNTTQGLRSRS